MTCFYSEIIFHIKAIFLKNFIRRLLIHLHIIHRPTFLIFCFKRVNVLKIGSDPTAPIRACISDVCYWILCTHLKHAAVQCGPEAPLFLLPLSFCSNSLKKRSQVEEKEEERKKKTRESDGVKERVREDCKITRW